MIVALDKHRPSVSTHSRPKAAGWQNQFGRAPYDCFNTQPPEGGWLPLSHIVAMPFLFQHTAARRRLAAIPTIPKSLTAFQHTAARRRLASIFVLCIVAYMFQHTAARRRLGRITRATRISASFNTQPPEGGWLQALQFPFVSVWFQHTAARRRLGQFWGGAFPICEFQHTAARRRLEPFLKALLHQVSQPRFR